jgi:hypothetical protein
MFLQKNYDVFFLSSLHEREKRSAVNDPFLETFLTFLRIKNATVSVYRSLKTHGANPFFVTTTIMKTSSFT